MGDIYCTVCGEPWDAYGVKHGDMAPDEAHRFLRGEGCPACHFGTKCRACNGTGKKKCLFCYGTGKVKVKEAQYYWDYTGRYHLVQKAEFEPCLECKGTGFLGDPCPTCGGTGKPSGGDPLEAAISEIEASDEDAIEILHRRRLLKW
jgi:RecJ-like exonuclease